jgi:hypothetical protein
VFDVDRDRAEEVDVLAVRWRNVRQHLVLDLAALSANVGDRQPVVLGGPRHDRVGHQRQAPRLLGLLLQAASTDRTLVRIQQVASQGVQALSFIELSGNLSPVGLVGQVAGRVNGAA